MPWSSYEDIPVPRRIFEMTAISRESSDIRGLGDEATADGVDTEGFAAVEELFLMRVAAGDLVRTSCWMALA